MDKDSAQYAEPIGPIKVTEPREEISFFQWAMLAAGAAAAVVGLGAVVTILFSLEPADAAPAAMPAAQHQRPFESDKELRRLTHPAPRFATEVL